MNKTSEYWQKFKQQTLEQLSKSDNFTLVSSCNKVTSEKEISRENHNSSVVQPRVYNPNLNINKNKEFDSNKCEVVRKEKLMSKIYKPSVNNACESKLDIKYIENLLSKITELKEFMNSFDTGSKELFDYISYNKQVGDPPGSDVKKRNKKVTYQIDSVTGKHAAPGQCKLANYIKNISEHQRSIYTNCEQNSKLDKSNTSLVMPLHSPSKNTFVKLNPNAETKYFQKAAEDFIQQAENLKDRITFMLEYCECQNISCSDRSVSHVSSEYSTTINQSCNSESAGDQNVKQLLNTLNIQYAQILKVLTSIEKHITTFDKIKKHKSFNKSRKRKKLSVTSANVCACMPDNAEKTELGKSNIMEVRKQKSCSEENKKKKHLEPVVLMYEPIKPKRDTVKEIYRHRSHSSNLSFYGQGNKHMKNIKENKKKKSELEHNFVIYSPNNSKCSVFNQKQPKAKERKTCCWCI